MKKISINSRYVIALVLLVWVSACPEAFAQLTTLHLEKYNNQLWLKVALRKGQTDSLLFMFDSGAQSCLLSPEAAAIYFNGVKGETLNGTGAGGRAPMKLLRNCTAYLHGLTLDSVNFLVNDLTALRNSTGRNFDGIIGYSLLAHFVTSIDLDKEVMKLYADIKDAAVYTKPIHFEYAPELGFAPKVHGAFTGPDGKHYEGSFIFDSGASLAIMLNAPYVDSLRLLTTIGKTLKLTSQSLTGTDVRYQGRAENFTFDGGTFHQLSVDLSRAKSGIFALPGYAGLLGNLIIYRFNVTFDYEHQNIYLQPNHYQNDPFPLPQSGITLALSGEKLIINAVDPDSPEAKAGLVAGDEIVSLNGKNANTLWEAKQLLLKPGKVVVRIKKNNNIKDVQINLYPRI